MPLSRLIATLVLAFAALSVKTAPAQNAAPFAKVAFYFAAHEDDWQLFMNPSAFEDVADPKTKTVFVHTTAGDAGLGTGKRGRKHPYYLARENGAETAVRFMADSRELPVEKTVTRMSFNGHDIDRMSYRNTVVYFLRLPDGSLTGDGYDSTGRQSLRRLANGDISVATAIDGSATYRGWDDLVATIHAIVDFERGEAPAVQINVPELNARLNPKDHSDHLMTAKAALDATAELSCADRRHFVNYASAKLRANLTEQQIEKESSVVAVTAAGLLAMDHASIWQPYYMTYLGRSYFRLEAGRGRCDGRAPEMSASRR
jgi:hypothetical protein